MGRPKRRVVAKRARQTAIFLGEAADYSRLWLLCGVLLSFFGNEGRTMARRGLQVVATSWVLTYGAIKPFLKRRRPADRDLWRLGGADEDSGSFPSSHAATGAAFATAVGSDDWRGGAMIGGLVVLVSYSRVTTRAHHISDVISGTALGVAVAIVLRWIESRGTWVQPGRRARPPASPDLAELPAEASAHGHPLLPDGSQRRPIPSSER